MNFKLGLQYSIQRQAFLLAASIAELSTRLNHSRYIAVALGAFADQQQVPTFNRP
jgi:hypothetical protein